MRAGTLFLVGVLLARSVSAQTPSSEPACGACARGAHCVRGACQFSCAQDADCRSGNVCVGAAEAPGQCEPRIPLRRPGAPATIRRSDATHPERFKAVQPVPPGFHLAREPSGEAIARGSLAFASAWLPMAIVAWATRAPLVAIPVAGPILSFRASTGPDAVFLNVALVTGIAIDAAVQLYGLFMAVAGFAVPSRWLERDAPLSFVPTPSGAGVVGHF